jgi:hypothetical protein
MLNETQAVDELRALRVRLAELERIARAPRNAEVTRVEIRRVEARGRKAARLAAAIEADPDYLAKLGRAKLAAAETARVFQLAEFAAATRARREMAADLETGDLGGMPSALMADVAMIDMRKETRLALLDGERLAAAAFLMKLRAWPQALADERERTQRKGYVPPEPSKPVRRIVFRREGQDR